ncbi:MAG: murein L,D-transpeptidase [Roseivirga sp.]
MALGDPIFIRIFKETNELEVWIKTENSEQFKLFKTYEICYYSGEPGPKTKQGDGQSPEGFYFINAGRFNPWSSFHLSLNMGYPNSYERAKGYTGNYLMIHGSCVSIGCYAMTDDGMEEIYTLAHKAVENGQKFFRVHAFPFRMTAEAMNRNANHKWVSFWENLKTGYDWFEESRIPPNVTLKKGLYSFN